MSVGRRTHFFALGHFASDEDLRSACRVEDRGAVVRATRITANLEDVDCKSCQDTPDFEATALSEKTSREDLVRLAHDVLLLLEPRDHRTLDQIAQWSQNERAAVAVWAGRCHLRASDNVVTVPPRPAVMSRDPEPIVPEATDIFGPRVCRCDELKDESKVEVAWR